MARLRLGAIPIPAKSLEVVPVNKGKSDSIFGKEGPPKANVRIWKDKTVNGSTQSFRSPPTTKVATLNKSVVGKSGQERGA